MNFIKTNTYRDYLIKVWVSVVFVAPFFSCLIITSIHGYFGVAGIAIFGFVIFLFSILFGLPSLIIAILLASIINLDKTTYIMKKIFFLFIYISLLLSTLWLVTFPEKNVWHDPLFILMTLTYALVLVSAIFFYKLDTDALAKTTSLLQNDL